MGRISKALDKLRTKCTESGTHPSGNSTADILECIAEHYAGGSGGGGFVDVTYHYTFDGTEVSHTPTEVKQLLEQGKTCFMHYVDDEDSLDYTLHLMLNAHKDSIFGYKFSATGSGDEYKMIIPIVGDFDSNAWGVNGNNDD